MLTLLWSGSGCQVTTDKSVDTDAAVAVVQLGPRPQYLVQQMQPGPLKTKLQACLRNPAKVSTLSIGHRGAPLQFPEHTLESYQAAATMGAKRIECDVVATSDGALVCRHGPCDLHSTTNILATPLASTCREPFTPADPVSGTPASARCCANDVTEKEFKSLCGRMPSTNPAALSVAEYLAASPPWRTTLYNSCGTLLSHRDSIAAINALGVDFIPELKPPPAATARLSPATIDTKARQQLAAQLSQDYRDTGIDPQRVWLQSFLWSDVSHWLTHYPAFAPQVVWLDGRAKINKAGDVPVPQQAGTPSFQAAQQAGLKLLAPPLWALLRSTNVPGTASTPSSTASPKPTSTPTAKTGPFTATSYALAAQQAGLQLVTWTLERSGPVEQHNFHPFSYFRSLRGAMKDDGDLYPLLHSLVTDIGVTGVFTDWAATVTFYDNCLAATESGTEASK